jgi:hypothetical protein
MQGTRGSNQDQQQRIARGTKFSPPHFLYEAVTRRSKRRLSRIAKGH